MDQNTILSMLTMQQSLINNNIVEEEVILPLLPVELVESATVDKQRRQPSIGVGFAIDEWTEAQFYGAFRMSPRE